MKPPSPAESIRTPRDFAFPLDTSVEVLFRTVWRDSLDRPGFALLLPPTPLETRACREIVVRLAEEFDRLAQAAGYSPLAFERLGRFDQQVTSKFHRDGAPEISILFLGYEPTTVKSRLLVADAEAAAKREGIGLTQFLSANNPMFSTGEKRLQGYTTELIWPIETGAIVILNNSLFPEDSAPKRLLGVLHKAEIIRPDPAATRVINSAGLTTANSGRVLMSEDLERFRTRADLD